MKITRHATKRLVNRCGVFCDHEEYALNVLKNGELLPQNLKSIYLNSVQNYKDGIMIVHDEFVFVFNNEKNILITVIKIKNI